jgi:hypothetical protein
MAGLFVKNISFSQILFLNCVAEKVFGNFIPANLNQRFFDKMKDVKNPEVTHLIFRLFQYNYFTF